jgi:prephenate dehydrogenase
MFSRIAVFGLGLLGGSICRGLRRISHNGKITAFARDPRKLTPALDDGTIDGAERIGVTGIGDADLVILCTPVFNSIELLGAILDGNELGSESLVIDVGSVKGPIVRAALCHSRADRFIGCHPMAGSEKTGYDASRADLYDGASVIVTPHEKNTRADLHRIVRFWESIGARVTEVDPDVHDSIVAHTSHLPHLLACSATHAVRGYSGSMVPEIGHFIGNGFLDVTRIAAGSPEMWTDIFLANADKLSQAARETMRIMESVLKELETAKGATRLMEFFNAARDFRKGL